MEFLLGSQVEAHVLEVLAFDLIRRARHFLDKLLQTRIEDFVHLCIIVVVVKDAKQSMYVAPHGESKALGVCLGAVETVVSEVERQLEFLFVDYAGTVIEPL